MPFVTANEVKLFYRFDGPKDAPVLLFSNSLGTTHAMWDAQLPAFAGHFRVLRYDARGHGQSEVTPGPYTVELLARDAVGLLDALGLDRVAFCGLSLGGMVGQWLGARAGDRLERLALCSTTAFMSTKDVWTQRIELVRAQGMAPLVEGTIERWFTEPFRERRPDAIEPIRRMVAGMSVEGYAASGAAVRDMDLRPLLPKIAVPTLLVAGRADPGTPPAEARAIADAVPDARLVELDGAHLINIEAETAFAESLLGFLSSR